MAPKKGLQNLKNLMFRSSSVFNFYEDKNRKFETRNLEEYAQLHKAHSYSNLFKKMDEESLKRDFSAHSRDSIKSYGRTTPEIMLARQKQHHGRCPFGIDV